MATRYLTRALFSTIKPMTSVISHSYTTSAVLPNSSFIIRLRPLVAAVSASYFRRLSPAVSARSFSTRQTSSSLNDPNPNWSNRPPKETILLDGCDFEHWLVVVEPPEADLTRDDIIDSYIKTLATVIGSEEEARMKIYSVSTRHYFAFGALVSEELSYKIKELPNVRWVLPDSYMDVRNKDYGGEPFINGQALPYDPRYHEEWVRNNSRANERNRRNDRPRNFDRSRNFERRREMTGGGNVGGGPGGGGNMGPPPPTAPNNGGMQPNYGGGMPQNNNSTGNYPSRGPAANNNGPNSYGPNSGHAPYQPSPGPVGPGQGQNQNNAYAPNGGGGNPYQGQNAPAQAPNRGYVQGQNVGGYAPNPGHAPGPNPNNYSQNPNNYGQNPNNYGQSQNGYGSNVGPGQGHNQGGYGNPSQNQNVPGRDPNY